MTDNKEIVQYGPFSYRIHESEKYTNIINIKTNEQAITIIVVKKYIIKSITYKNTYTLEKIAQIAHPFMSHIDKLVDVKKEIGNMIVSKSFEIKEDKNMGRILLSLKFTEPLNNTIMIKELVLPKFHEEQEKDIQVLLRRLTKLSKNQDNKISYIDHKDIEISKRISTLEQNYKEIENDFKILSLHNSKQQPIIKQASLSKTNNNNRYSFPMQRPNDNTQINVNPVNRKILVPSVSLNSLDEHSPITQWISKTHFIKFESIYKGSQCNFSSTFFHSYYDNAVPTVIILTIDNGARCGGFTCQTWKGENVDKQDNQAFLFSFDHNQKYPIKTDNISRPAIHCQGKYIVAFGGVNEFDLLIVDQGNKYECSCDFPVNYGNNESKYCLTLGKRKFGLKEIEIFQVHYKD